MSRVGTPVAQPGRAASCHPARLRALFDALAGTYGLGNWFSGGLLRRWRQQLAGSLHCPGAGPVQVVDLMAGGADLWPALRQHLGPGLRMVAVDFSAAMLARAARHAAGPALVLCPADALATPLPSGQAAAVTCAFGLKTLTPAEYPALAAEAARLLRPGGEIALVELALPRWGWRRHLVLGYLRALLPVLSWLRPAADAHKALLTYARTAPDWPALATALRMAGFGPVRQRRLWPGCAVLVEARWWPKPAQ